MQSTVKKLEQTIKQLKLDLQETQSELLYSHKMENQLEEKIDKLNNQLCDHISEKEELQGLVQDLTEQLKRKVLDKELFKDQKNEWKEFKQALENQFEDLKDHHETELKKAKLETLKYKKLLAEEILNNNPTEWQ